MKTSFLLSLSVFGSMALLPAASAQQGNPIAGYKLLDTITLPGGLVANDISWVDPETGRYYLADRGTSPTSNTVPPRLDVVDTVNDQLVSTVILPAAGNGVVGLPRQHEVWVGLNDSTVQVINTDTLTITHQISTGGTMRADETAYDPADRLLLIANDRDSPPFVTFISTATYTVVKKIPYDGVSANLSTGGLEQSVWDGVTQKFYLAVPATQTNANGEVDELDPQSLKVTRVFPTKCTGPAGNVLIPNQRLMVSCGDVIDILSGQVVTTVPGVGGDEIYYNAADQRVYFGGGTDRISISVVDANTYAPVTTLTVGVIVAAPGVSQTTHSVAADSGNNKVFVPVTGAGIQVWRNGASMSVTPNPIPVTGSADGAGIVTWSAPNASVVEIHVGSPTGPLFAHVINHGAQPTAAWLTDGVVLFLQDVSSGPAAAANTVATAIVHLQPH
jgi:hypothetical protein